MKVLTTAGLTKLIQLCKNAIPTVNNSTITITQGGVTKGSFTLNQASGDTIALDAGSGGSGDVVWATYGTTTHQQILDWANAGKEVLVKNINGVTIYRLVHADVSEHIFTTANLKAISYCYVTSQNVWYSSANNLQVEIPAGTAGNVITYTGTAGSIGSATLATVATSGDYNDLSNKPTIPTVNDSTITITQGGVVKGSFTLNQASGDTIALDAGGGGGVPDATDQVKGIAKLYNTSGSNTDGSMTQSAITNEIINSVNTREISEGKWIDIWFSSYWSGTRVYLEDIKNQSSTTYATYLSTLSDLYTNRSATMATLKIPYNSGRTCYLYLVDNNEYYFFLPKDGKRLRVYDDNGTIKFEEAMFREFALLSDLSNASLISGYNSSTKQILVHDANDNTIKWENY